jgi:5-deoxy-glucuronate isomerase
MTKRLIKGTAGERGRRIFIQPADGSMKLLSYGRIRLNKEEPEIRFSNDGQETGLICLNGTCVVKVGNESFEMKRDDALYVPKCSTIAICTEQEVDVLECSAPVDGQYLLRFVAAESVRTDEKLHLVAGTDGARREINILLGNNIQAGRLIVGVTRSLPGNWTSWPPHEHATMLEEIYVYVDMPAPAFGLQLVYEDEISPTEVEVVREGDAVLLPAGYHPNVSIPGSTLNFVWIMAAHREVVDRKWGVVQMDPRYS